MTTRFVPRWVLESDDPVDEDPILTVSEVQHARSIGDAKRLARAKVLLARPDTGEVVPISANTVQFKLAAGWKEPVAEALEIPEPEVVYVERVVIERERPVRRWLLEAAVCGLVIAVTLVLPQCQS